MMLSKEELIKEFFIKEKKYRFNNSKFRSLKDDDIRKISLLNYYNDSSSLIETYTRLINNLDDIPLCPVCGKKLKWIDSKRRFQHHCSQSCAIKDKLTQEKRKQTCLKLYGVENNSQLESNKQLIQETCLKRYGVKSPLSKGILRDKGLETKLKKYGSKTYNNPQKTTKTCFEKYGSGRNYKKIEKTLIERYNINSYLKSSFVNSIRNNKEIQEKISNTKKKNNSFNISKEENQSYELLKSKYPDVQKQYKSELYPFNCDFYIPSLDLYIECNYHWTHGFHPYDPNNIEDKNKLKLWKSKSTKFYDNAIKTWTIRDINKRNIVKENKLNWIEFFDIKELKKWLK